MMLSSVARIVSGGTPKTGEASFWNGDVPWATPKDLSGLESVEIRSTPRLITEAGLRNSSAELLPENSVLFSSRAPIGLLAINTTPMATNQGFKSFVPDPERLDSRYLYRWLEANRARLQNMGVGATFKEVSKAIVSRLLIPLPSLDEQRRIAAILDKADELRTKRRKALADLDTLTQSIFDSMFGDPVQNEQGWDWHPVSDFISDATGGKNIVGSADEEGGYRVLKISAVTSLRFNPAETKPLPAGYVPPDQHLLRKGDLLFSRANTTELVGATALVREAPERVSLPDKIWRLEPDRKMPTDPRFVEALFQHKTFRAKISALASGSSGSMKNISKPKLFSIHTGMPPFELQLAFGNRVETTTRLQNSGRRQLAELDTLFASLQDRAFRGEL
ncbi:restriction endonuclease subunit S [Arthrobacter sp. 1P04PC]|uniref:restriction endonuclease subunit S n=1 Tax=Arthrobacter sp. 1P04PC TaxID=3132262 RepID=UPI0039A24711